MESQYIHCLQTDFNAVKMFSYLLYPYNLH